MDFEKLQQDLVPAPTNIKSSVRKVVVFLIAVTLLAAVYQIMMFNFVLPGQDVRWRRGSVELLQEFDDQGRRLAALVMLEADIQNEDIPLDVFKDPTVREEFNRLRLVPMLIAIDPSNTSQSEWLRDQGFQKLPGLLLFMRANQAPVLLNAEDLQPRPLAKTLNDLRFDRYEPQP